MLLSATYTGHVLQYAFIPLNMLIYTHVLISRIKYMWSIYAPYAQNGSVGTVYLLTYFSYERIVSEANACGYHKQ